MRVGRSILLAAARNKQLNDFALSSAVVRRATRKFMPGESVEDALGAAAHIAASGRGIVLTQLGEAIESAADAAVVRDHYLLLFERIQSLSLPAQISVKPTQLGLDASFEDCESRLLELSAAAMHTGSVLWLDMEDSRYVDPTLALYRSLKRRHPSVGIALQAYLRRTPADVESLLPLDPIIRLVKGAYDESPSVAYALKKDTDAAYYAISRRLLECAREKKCLPIFGTHDTNLLRRIIAEAAALHVDNRAFEIHMLYGIREEDQLAFVHGGFTVKTLISYGSAWFRWYMRRLAERPANVWFVLRSLAASA
jgi:proline dehydrogenase